MNKKHIFEEVKKKKNNNKGNEIYTLQWRPKAGCGGHPPAWTTEIRRASLPYTRCMADVIYHIEKPKLKTRKSVRN